MGTAAAVATRVPFLESRPEIMREMISNNSNRLSPLSGASSDEERDENGNNKYRSLKKKEQEQRKPEDSPAVSAGSAPPCAPSDPRPELPLSHCVLSISCGS